MPKSKINWPDWVWDGSEIDWTCSSLYSTWRMTFGNSEASIKRFWKSHGKHVIETKQWFSTDDAWNAMMDELGYTEIFND